MVGNHIKVFWNGNLDIDYIDRTMSPKLASGTIAMYSEDAYVVVQQHGCFSKVTILFF